jgi:hypothetical protein
MCGNNIQNALALIYVFSTITLLSVFIASFIPKKLPYAIKIIAYAVISSFVYIPIKVLSAEIYPDSIENQPKSWETSRETPTVYRLEFSDGTPDKLLLTSGNPDWHDGKGSIGGFNFSLSDDEGKSWSEFELVFSKKDNVTVIPTVAMASLTRLKENGKFVDKWMAFFHNASFVNYKTILTFIDGKPVWSDPEPYFSKYRKFEKKSNMCEVEVIRSDKGMGDELCLIARCNNKRYNSIVSFSKDEGKTWSKPRFVPSALNGERHKADYTSDGRIFITFRSIERSKEKIQKYSVEHMKN